MYHLSSINIAGNSLRIKDEERMIKILVSMIQMPEIQHVDLSLTELSLKDIQ